MIIDWLRSLLEDPQVEIYELNSSEIGVVDII